MRRHASPCRSTHGSSHNQGLRRSADRHGPCSPPARQLPRATLGATVPRRERGRVDLSEIGHRPRSSRGSLPCSEPSSCTPLSPAGCGPSGRRASRRVSARCRRCCILHPAAGHGGCRRRRRCADRLGGLGGRPRRRLAHHARDHAVRPGRADRRSRPRCQSHCTHSS